MATSNKRSNTKKDKIAEPITPETRAEKINKLVEEDAKVTDVQEEKFLESTVAEIEAQPVVVENEFTGEPEDEFPPAEDVPPMGEPDMTPIINEPVVVDPVTGNINVKFEFQDEYHFGPGNGDAVIDTLPEPCVCVEPCECDKPCEGPCECDKPCVCEKPEEIVEAPKFQLGQQIQKLAEVDIEPTVCAPVTTPQVKKTFAQMTATEMNIYKKTGIIPFV